MTVTMSVVMDRMYKKMLFDFGRELLGRCGARHSFDVEEEMRELGVCDLEVIVGVRDKLVKNKLVKGKEKRAVPRIPFPFSGVIVEGCCAGLKQNHGLMSQCLSFPCENNDKNLCNVCKRESDKNASGEPNCGLVKRRLEEGINFKDAKGRSPALYTKVMKKLKLTEEHVLSEASKFQIPFNKEHFKLSDTKKGRPKKGVEEPSDSDAEESKKRGRPKKDKKEVEVSSNDNDDLFANLISSAVEEQSQAEEVVVSTKEAPKKEAPKDTRALVGGTQGHFKREDAKNKIEEENVEDEDVEVVNVDKIEFNGKKYLKSAATNVMYDLSGETVGVWNEAKQEIVFNELEEEDEDEGDDDEDDEDDDEGDEDEDEGDEDEDEGDEE